MPRQRKSGKGTQAITVDSLVALASGLSRPELDDLIAALLALRDALDEEEAKPNEVEAVTPRPRRSRSGASPRIEWKIINGCGPYPYLRYKSGGTHHSFYLKNLKPK
ncbi:MAG: hypothetical protein NW224_12970 [Leptolyngbyaceae cyanobacterium bins.302]|nr:hypothetical protein [Leptolyngbyaceae cyanobacterium bins.302]